METAREDIGTHSTFRIREADVVVEAFPDETIAVNLATGRYYSIDLMGAEMLGLLSSGHELGVIAGHLGERYGTDPVSVETSLTGFTAQLLDEGLLLPAPGAEAESPLPEAARASAAFTAPTLSVYSDMEDLLLLDPIHDVDETGWPVRADDTDPEPAGPRDAG